MSTSSDSLGYQLFTYPPKPDSSTYAHPEFLLLSKVSVNYCISWRMPTCPFHHGCPSYHVRPCALRTIHIHSSPPPTYLSHPGFSPITASWHAVSIHGTALISSLGGAARTSSRKQVGSEEAQSFRRPRMVIDTQFG